MNADDTSQSPFTKPRFIVAAILVAFIVIFGIAIVFINASKDDPDLASPESVESSSPSPPPGEEPPIGGASICGLEGVVLEGSLPIAPDTQWEYQGTTAYPVSPKYGPGEVSEGGYRYCFQHSPEGALFMAANAVSQGTYDDGTVGGWLNYVVAEGPYREELLTDIGDGGTTDNGRLSIRGFRLLAYDGTTARVDLAVRATVEGQTVVFSGVYDLVWQEGDWKISTDTPAPLNMAQIPDMSGYITWGE